MEWVNYHHLFYFWVTAREGSITAAASVLRLAQPTVSAQLRQLEESLGAQLFSRAGRGIRLTPRGELAFRYAEQIFSLGREMYRALRSQETREEERLVIGISDSLPRLLVSVLLAPLLRQPSPLLLLYRDGPRQALLDALGAGTLDLLLLDEAPPPAQGGAVQTTLIGTCGLSLLGTPALRARYGRPFPGALAGAPLLLPALGQRTRDVLDGWFASRGVWPRTVAELCQPSLIKALGAAGTGLFAVPTIIEADVCERHGVELVGHLAEARVAFYLSFGARHSEHPAVRRLTGAQRFDE